MAVLSSSDRKAMPSKEFAGPGKSFPVNDETHARMAISGATRSEHAGNISAGEAERIKSEARAKLAHWGKGGDGKPMDHKAEVAKMHPEHLHRMATEAAAGNHGPAMQQMASKAMAPQMASDHDGDEKPGMKSSPFSDHDGDEMGGESSSMPSQGGGMNRSSMFGMGGGE